MKAPEGATLVIIGRDYYDGQPDRWRAGWILDETLDTGLCLNGRPLPGRAGSVFVDVYCPPRGKERKGRTHKCVITALIRDTPEVRAKLLAAGFDPDQRHGIAKSAT